jgi:hypothetical protein
MTADNAAPTVRLVAGVPVPAAAYGAGGLLPFIGTAVAAWVVDPMWASLVATVQVAYGATILSFLGAAHWGLALAGQGTGGDSVHASTWTRLGLSVLPAIVAWFAMLMALQPSTVTAGIALQMLTFIGLLLGDQHAARIGLAPAWYPRLRWWLTSVALVAMLICLIRVLAAPGV